MTDPAENNNKRPLPAEGTAAADGGAKLQRVEVGETAGFQHPIPLDGLKLMQSGEYADCTIVCAFAHHPRELWRLHKGILCLRSEWFKEKQEEAEKKSSPPMVSIRDATADQISKVIEYIYTGDIIMKDPKENDKVYSDCIALYKLSGTFRLPNLRSVADKKLCDFVLRCIRENLDYAEKLPEGRKLFKNLLSSVENLGNDTETHRLFARFAVRLARVGTLSKEQFLQLGHVHIFQSVAFWQPMARVQLEEPWLGGRDDKTLWQGGGNNADSQSHNAPKGSSKSDDAK